MARFRRRRKARPLWFPPLGTTFSVADDTVGTGMVTWALPVLGSGAISFQEIPLTFDFGQEAELTDTIINPGTKTLADLMESAWRVRRVVGKLYATYQIKDEGIVDPLQTGYPACYLKVGLMVRNVDQFGQPPGTNVDLLNRDDYTDPWIWQRSWILGQHQIPNRYQTLTSTDGVILLQQGLQLGTLGGAAAAAEFVAYASFPRNNAIQSGLHDGPHVDAKTNRVIGPEQRLFLHFAAKGLPIQPQGGITGDNDIFGLFDLRLLGNLQRSTNRRNASR